MAPGTSPAQGLIDTLGATPTFIAAVVLAVLIAGVAIFAGARRSPMESGACVMTAATAPVRAITDDITLIERSGQAVPNSISRDCRQPGCVRRAGWIVLGHRTVPLCTRDASRRIRRRALPRRWAR